MTQNNEKKREEAMKKAEVKIKVEVIENNKKRGGE
jgi:hypothetical protein